MAAHVHTWTKVLSASGVWVKKCTGCGATKPA